ncbi:unnamed protein product [Pleuronectes platessa]|uniref:Uncharacterized protein n=1 Tax=Pleuronectes platessa TaxID=8262 RepID=A0A9N7VKR4_PLEPL|nr:unnamed protein product [Pleuronectes platessa]
MCRYFEEVRLGTDFCRESKLTQTIVSARLNNRSESSADVSATQSELISPVTAVRAADGAYMHICETEVFSMGVFLLRPGASIPLHVHPDMNGNLRSNLIRKLPFQHIQLARRSRDTELKLLLLHLL